MLFLIYIFNFSGLRNRQISGSSRVQMRGTSRAKASVEEKVIVTTAPSTPENPSQPELEPEPAATETEPEASPVKEEAPVEKTPKQPPKEEPQQESPQSGKRSVLKLSPNCLQTVSKIYQKCL